MAQQQQSSNELKSASVAAISPSLTQSTQKENQTEKEKQAGVSSGIGSSASLTPPNSNRAAREPLISTFAVRSSSIDSPGMLASWKVPQRGYSRHAFRWSVSLIVVALVVGFAIVLLAPYRNSKLKVIVLFSGSADDRSAVDSASQSADLASMWLQKIGSETEAAFERFTHVDDMFARISGLNESSLTELTQRLSESGSHGEVAMCQLAGILRWTPRGCLLCESSVLAAKEHGVSVHELIGRIAKAANRPVVVCIDILADPAAPYADLADYAEMLACRSEIELALKNVPSSQLAVTIARDIDPGNAAGARPSLAKSCAKAVEQLSQRSSASHTLNSLLMTITNTFTSLGGQENLWLFSSDWPNTQKLPSLPNPSQAEASLADNSQDISEQTAASNAIAPAALGEDAASKEVDQNRKPYGTHAASQVQKLTDEQFNETIANADASWLLGFLWDQRDQWLESVDSSNSDAEGQAFLRINATPNAWRRFEAYLLAAEQARAFNKTSSWLDELKQVSAATRIVATDRNSLSASRFRALPKIARDLLVSTPTTAQLVAFRKLDLPEQMSAPDYEQVIPRLVAEETSEAAARAMLEAWQSQLQTINATAAIDSLLQSWAKVYFAREHVPWQIRQSLLRCKFESLKTACNPDGDFSRMGLWQVAELLRLQSENASATRTAPDWLSQSTQWNSQALDHYATCEAFAKLRREAVATVTQVCRELPNWSQVWLAGDDRNPVHDPIVRCIDLIAEVVSELEIRETDSQLLENGVSYASKGDLLESELIEQTSELSIRLKRLQALHRDWQEVAEASCRGQDHPHFDTLAFLDSPLAKLLHRQLADTLHPAAQGELLVGSHAKIWMHATRRKCMQELIDMLLASSQMSTTQATPTGAELTGLMNLAESSSASHQQLLVSTEKVDREFQAWIDSRLELVILANEQRREIDPVAGLAAMWLMVELDDTHSVMHNVEELQNLDIVWQQLVRRTRHFALTRHAEHCRNQANFSDQFCRPLITEELRCWTSELDGLADQAEAAERTELIELSSRKMRAEPIVSLESLNTCDLRMSAWRQIPLRLTNRSDTPQELSLRCEFNAELLSVEIDGRRATKRGKHELQFAIMPSESREFSLLVSRPAKHTADQTADQSPIAFQLQMAATGERQHHVFETQLAGRLFASIIPRNKSVLDAATFAGATVGEVPASGQIEVADWLFANRVNSIAFDVANLSDQAAQFSIQLYAASQPILTSELPQGVLEPVDLQHWLGSQSLQLLSQTVSPMVVPAKQTQPLKLPPQKLPPEAGDLLIHNLILIVQNKSTEQSQVVAWSPRALRPAAYVQPSIQLDRETRELHLNFKTLADSGLPLDPVRVTATVTEFQPLSDRVIARGSLSLTSKHSSGQMLLRLTEAKSSKLCVQVAVDDWPNAFVASVDLLGSDRQIEIASEVQAVRVSEVKQRQVVPAANSFVEIAVEAVVSDGALDASQDRIEVGLDLDRDRRLGNEPVASLAAAVEATSMWRGIDAAGDLLLEYRVSTPVVRLPVEPTWNVRGSILASASRGSQVLWSIQPELVIDHQSPLVTRVWLSGNGGEAMLGKPVEVRVAADDNGLSGVANVQAAWSLSGAGEFADQVEGGPPTEQVVVSGANLGDGLWSLMLTTETLRSGSTLLLVRAMDAAGNTSRTTSTFIEVLDEAGLEAKRSLQKTYLSGRVEYNKRAFGGAQITLASEASDELEQTATSDAHGGFTFGPIGSGKYTVTVKATVRGMRQQRTQVIEVKAPSMPPPIHFQLDKPE